MVGVHGADQDGEAQLPIVSYQRKHDWFPDQLEVDVLVDVDTAKLGGTSLNTEPASNK